MLAIWTFDTGCLSSNDRSPVADAKDFLELREGKVDDSLAAIVTISSNLQFILLKLV